MINIEKAIEHYNKNVRVKSEQRMTQRSLGLAIMPEKTPINSENYIYRLIKGNPTIRIDLVAKICKACDVDANFLFKK